MFVYIIAFVMGVNMVLISRSMYEDSIFLYKKEKAEKALAALQMLEPRPDLVTYIIVRDL